jgi:hypothetical protein
MTTTVTVSVTGDVETTVMETRPEQLVMIDHGVVAPGQTRVFVAVNGSLIQISERPLPIPEE